MKITIFLVDRVPLVFQQAGVIAANCDLRVKWYCGEMGVDLWGDKQWNQVLENNDVLVMTGQILLDMLRHGFVSLSKVNLLIFDESHHCVKKHNFNLIMREFYDRCPASDQPKIFGMTASPMNSKTGVQYSASRLEQNLKATIYTIPNEEMRQWVIRPDQKEVIYDLPPKYPKSKLYTTIWEQCNGSSRLQKAFSAAGETLSTLGPWCADRLWQFVFDDIDVSYSSKLESDIDTQSTEEEKILIRRALAISQDWNYEKPDWNRKEELFSPKVIVLLKILHVLNTNSEGVCGIVFVERRQTAKILNTLIQEFNEFLPSIKCGVLVGHGSSDDGDVKMDFKIQNRTIEKFRNGQINLLIATNVAEEGLDIQPCNVVIRFDFFHTLIAYIQSRGRARKPGSRYVLMIEKDNNKHRSLLDEVHRTEEEWRSWTEIMPENRGMDLENIRLDDDDDDAFDTDASYVIPSTGAMITLDSAIPLIHRYCASLPADQYCNLRPTFVDIPEGQDYTCKLVLPSNAPIREIFSELVRSKSYAKKSVALKACIELHKRKCLTDHLMPEREWLNVAGETNVVDERGVVEGTKRARSLYSKKIPAFWSLPEELTISALESLYLTILEVNFENYHFNGQEYRTLCLLTRKPFPNMPSFSIYIQGEEKTVNVSSYPTAIQISKDQVELLAKFTIKVSSSIVNKDFLCPVEELPYMIAPLKSQSSANTQDPRIFNLIDWAEIEIAVNNVLIPFCLDKLDEKDTLDAIIVDFSDNQRRYFVEAVRYDMNPLSSIVQGENVREVGCDNYAQYYKKKFDLEFNNPSQPLFQVSRVSKVLNFLQKSPARTRKLKGHVASFIIPEFCRRFAIRASIFRSMMMLPSILTRLDSFLLVQEVRDRYNLRVSDTLLLEAFSTPSANMMMNYERLETLGDSFLKFIATIRLYIIFPDQHEGQLHRERIRIICNKALYKSAKQMEIFEHISSQPFNRRLWRPHGFVMTTDDPNQLKETKEHELSDKTLADVVEASLGSAYLSSGIDGGMTCAIAFGVPFDGIGTTWADFQETYDRERKNRPNRIEKDLREVNVAAIENLAGYHFREPLLIVEALTHASLPNSTAPCYQRLEFLGDAVLDFLTIRYLFHKYPDAPPGRITALKDAMVNNQILAAICESVGLIKHILHFSPKLIGAFTEFSRTIERMRENGECVNEYWSDLEVPKVLSDVIESMLGAVFVDCRFKVEVVQDLFDRWIRPILDEHVKPETLKEHPMQTLTTTLQAAHCAGLLLRNHTVDATSSEAQKCTIFLHDDVVAIETANNVRMARKHAAERVLEKLRNEPEYLKSICDCPRTVVDTADDDDMDY